MKQSIRTDTNVYKFPIHPLKRLIREVLNMNNPLKLQILVMITYG